MQDFWDASHDDPFNWQDFKTLIEALFDSADVRSHYLSMFHEGDFAFYDDETKSDYDRRGRCIVSLHAIGQFSGRTEDYRASLLDCLGDDNRFRDHSAEVIGILETSVSNTARGLIANLGEIYTNHPDMFRQDGPINHPQLEHFRDTIAGHREDHALLLFCFEKLSNIRDALHLKVSDTLFDPLPDYVQDVAARGYDPAVDDNTNVTVLTFKR